jgi:hypothetical protein
MVFSEGDSAGNVTVSGGSIPAGTTLMNEGTNYYDDATSGDFISPGETIYVSASGGIVPAFSMKGVTAPSAVALTAPALSADGGSADISTAADLHVAWSGGQAGATVTLQASSEGLGTSMSYATISCSWDGGLGQGTVPKSILSMLAGGGPGTLTYGQESATTFTAGAYSIAESVLLYSVASANFE